MIGVYFYPVIVFQEIYYSIWLGFFLFDCQGLVTVL